jgi:hypothetical protein
MRFIQHDHRILVEIWVSKAFSLEHAVRQVLDLRLRVRKVLETDRIANLLTEGAGDLFCNTFCHGHGSDATGLCATDSTAVCVSVFEKILRHLSCFAGSSFPDNDEDLMLAGGQQ